jgi:hypothetical protein
VITIECQGGSADGQCINLHDDVETFVFRQKDPVNFMRWQETQLLFMEPQSTFEEYRVLRETLEEVMLEGKPVKYAIAILADIFK